MFRRCQTLFCILFLACMVSAYNSTPRGHRGALSFSNSLRLTRTIRARVQQLLLQYKQHVFGGELFEHGDLRLSTLPAVTVGYQTWLHMEDTERLRLASHYLQTYWTHLEGQRQQFERERDATKERREPRGDKRGRPQPTLCQSFVGLQIDLRDLMRQVNSQLRHMTQMSASTKSPLLHQLHSTSSTSPFPSMHQSTDSTKKLQTPNPTDDPHSSAHSTALHCTIISDLELRRQSIDFNNGEEHCQPPANHPGISCENPGDNNSRAVPLDSASERICDTERSRTVLEQIGTGLHCAPN